MRPPRLALGCLLAGAVFTSTASAATYSVQIKSIDGANANYFVCGIGALYTFPLLPGAAVGQVWSVDVDMSTNPWTFSNATLAGTSCPGPSGPAPGAPGAGQTGPPWPGQTFKPPGQTGGPVGAPIGGGIGDDGGEDSRGLAELLPRTAFNKVFTFKCDDDGYANGVVSVTITSIKGLGKSIKDDFNEAVDDQDGLVLVGKGVKVLRKGKQVGRGQLDDADEIAVKGKLLKPEQWREDEDGNEIPTIRAKRITILG